MNWYLVASILVFIVALMGILIFLDYQRVDRDWGLMAVVTYTLAIFCAGYLIYEASMYA